MTVVEFVSWLKDWGALVVAGAALLVTLVTARRATRKDRVFWVQRDNVPRVGDRAGWWNVTIRNYGHGVAGDVRMYLVHQFLTEPQELGIVPTVELGAKTTTNVAVEDLTNQTLGTLKIILKWRQAPNFEMDRVQEFPFPMAKAHTGTGA